MDISELLAFAVKNKASDLHLSASLPPMKLPRNRYLPVLPGPNIAVNR